MRPIDADALKQDWLFRGDDGKPYRDTIDAQPTIEERKTGRWINHRCDDGHHIADCDKCGHSLQWFDDDTPTFCCECGAKMEVDND